LSAWFEPKANIGDMVLFAMSNQLESRRVFYRSRISSTVFFPAAIAFAFAMQCWPQDISPTYQWKPVRIGGGGWVVGMVIHPLNPNVRYLRTDVGNAYRWDVANQQWDPMRISNTNGSGVQGPDVSAPSSGGEESIAIDPSDPNTVYMVFPTAHSCDIQCPTNFDEIYKSIDGGLNFTHGNMESAAIVGNANGAHRTLGERLMVDPANSQVLYYGTSTQGLFRSLDGGTIWTQLFGFDSAAEQH
jgi:hypothetical protein